MKFLSLVLFTIFVSQLSANIIQLNDDYCQTYLNQRCIQCKSGYQLDPTTNSCLEIISIQIQRDIIDENCKQSNEDGSCDECYPGFYYDAIIELRCIPVNPDCATYNKLGQCLSCFSGYKPYLGNCVLEEQIPIKDANCAVFSDDEQICQQCAFRYFFNQDGKCTQVSPDCASWDSIDGSCNDCYPGYNLIQNQCILEDILLKLQIQQQPLPGLQYCIQPPNYQNSNQTCTKCQSRAQLINGICYKVSDQCKQWNQQAYCTLCYGGYKLVQGSCILQALIMQAEDTQQEAKFQNCFKKNQQQTECQQCAQRFYFRENGYCVKVSDLCDQWNQINGQCTSCYKGYELNDGICYIPDPYCTYRSIYYGCVQCIDRYYLANNGKCTLVSQLCDQYDPFTGECTSCIQGFMMNEQQIKCEEQENI